MCCRRRDVRSRGRRRARRSDGSVAKPGTSISISPLRVWRLAASSGCPPGTSSSMPPCRVRTRHGDRRWVRGSEPHAAALHLDVERAARSLQHHVVAPAPARARPSRAPRASTPPWVDGDLHRARRRAAARRRRSALRHAPARPTSVSSHAAVLDLEPRLARRSPRLDGLVGGLHQGLARHVRDAAPARAGRGPRGRRAPSARSPRRARPEHRVRPRWWPRRRRARLDAGQAVHVATSTRRGGWPG